MLFLPKNVGALALAASRDATRYSLHGVRVQEFAGDQYMLAASDGRIMALLRGHGHNNGIANEQMFSMANDCFDYIVPAEDWRKAFASISHKERGAIQTVGVIAQQAERDESGNPIKPETVMLATLDQTRVVPTIDGRFPNALSMIPDALSVVSVQVQPALLIRLLTVAERLLDDGSAVGGVWLHFYGEGKPVGISAKTDMGQLFDGLIMPLVDGKDRPVREEEPPEADEPAIVIETDIEKVLESESDADAQAQDAPQEPGTIESDEEAGRAARKVKEEWAAQPGQNGQGDGHLPDPPGRPRGRNKRKPK